MALHEVSMIGQHYYTHCTREAGCEGITGYQTRAKSPSITPEVEQAIKRYCTYELPRSLDRLKARTGDLTDAELASTPISVHFFPIGENRWGLTRIRLHPRQRDRGGNFFAHTLVLPRAALRAVDFNPFEVLRSGVFAESEGNTGKELPDLRALPARTRGMALALPRGAPRDPVKEVLRALLVKPADRRTVVLLPAAPENSAAIFESALLLLPAECRASIALSTYEPDPYRLLGSDDAKPPVQVMIGTISSAEGGRFQFREDEYAASYYVINVPASRASQPVPASPGFVGLAEAVLAGDDDRSAHQVGDVQRVVGSLHLTEFPQKWDAVIPAAPLVSGTDDLSTEDWRTASRALASSCGTEATTAKSAFSLLWSRFGPSLASVPVAARADVSRASKRLLQAAVGMKRFYGLAAALVVLAIAATFVLGRGPLQEARSQIAALQKRIEELPKGPAVGPADEQFAKQVQEALQIPGVKPRIERGVALAQFGLGLFGADERLNDKGRAVLVHVQEKLIPLQKRQKLLIEVEGHTDSRPVRAGARYRDNYSLGLLRAGTAIDSLRAGGLGAQFRASSVGPDEPLPGSDPADPINRTVVLRIQPLP